ncbi:MAG: hypothetical protein RML93_11525 [Anaerolineales bacterium]|nr:hypothetical protein [Anaerolineales bacterium]MDW8447904.1 hypothetical protein [Anaerolineales bacterium]
MSKYARFDRRPPPKGRPWKVHPIWRGIGCILFVLIPVLSYAAAALLVESNLLSRWVVMPPELMMTVRIPFLPIPPIRHFFANVLVGSLLAVLGFGALTILYTLVYRLSGGSSLGPLDAPPIYRQRRRRS